MLSIAACSALAYGDKHDKKTTFVKKEQKECGIAGDAKAVKRAIKLSMSDEMRFTPVRIAVKEGEPVRNSLKNTNQKLLEMVLGTKKELDDHAALMLKFPDMEHAEPYMAHIAPGKTGEIIWTFNKPGDFDFACLIAGHYQVGMAGKYLLPPSNRFKFQENIVNIFSRTLTAIVMLSFASPHYAAAPVETVVMTSGEVKKIDKETHKITIKHGEITNLDMPAMTMVFQAGDAALLERVKPGDEIKFAAEKTKSGYGVTAIEVVK